MLEFPFGLGFIIFVLFEPLFVLLCFVSYSGSRLCMLFLEMEL